MNFKTGALMIYISLLSLSFSGCKSLKDNARFAKCEFKISGINKLYIAGVDMLNKRSIKDFSTNEGLKLAY